MIDMITDRASTIFVVAAAAILTAAIFASSGVATSTITPTFAQDENMTGGIGNVTEGNMTGPDITDGGMETTPPVIAP